MAVVGLMWGLRGREIPRAQLIARDQRAGAVPSHQLGNKISCI